MDETTHAKPEPTVSHSKWGRRKFLFISAIILANLILLSFIIFQLLSPPTTSNSSDPLVGKKAPAFISTLAPSYNSQTALTSSQLSGKAVVLNFWATWCNPCQLEAPLLETAWQQILTQNKAVIIIGVDYGESSSVIFPF